MPSTGFEPVTTEPKSVIVTKLDYEGENFSVTGGTCTHNSKF